MDVIYGIDNPLFLENMRDREYLTKTLLPWLIKYQVNIRKAGRLSEPVQAYLRRFSNNNALIDMIIQHFFKNTPTFFALSYFGLYLDYSYPKGGTGTLAQKISEYIADAGGEILTGTAVTNIDTYNKEISLTNGQKLRYRKLIWAADQKTLYSILKCEDTSAIGKQRILMDKNSGGDSILTLFAGVDLDKDYFANRCGAHAFYTPIIEGLSSLTDWRNAAESGNEALLDWIGSYLERTTYEISCPVLRDASLAPDGKSGIIVSTLMDYELVRHFADCGEYETVKQYCTNKIMSVLDASIFPEISDKKLFISCSTPLTIERETGNSQGAITGWAFTSDAMPSENRFRKIAKSIKTPIKDVFQCGQWSFSPSGMPVSILTGKLAADAVSKALKG